MLLSSGVVGGGRFSIVRLLGVGGMGKVYEAVDLEHGTRVALKTLRHLDGRTLMLFKQEFRAVHDLQHPNLIRLGELLEHSGEWFFTMELIDGQDFLTHLRSGADQAERVEPTEQGLAYATTFHNGPETQTMTDMTMTRPVTAGGDLQTDAPPRTTRPARVNIDEAKLRPALAQLTRGLQALHEHGKIHRDVKPSNILVDGDGRVVILDFGLITERDGAAAGVIAGTPSYMAPEQAAGEALSPAADWYSVGVMLYRALTGRLPFTGSLADLALAKQLRDPPRPRAHAPQVAKDLDALCMDLLQHSPHARPSGAEILERLGVTDPSPKTTTAETTGRGGHQVGRKRELERLDDALRDAADHAVMVWIRGESGIGKSELVRRFTDKLAGDEGDGEDQGQGALILAGRCYEREEVPYKAFDGVADALCRTLVELDDEQVAALLPAQPELLATLFPVLSRVPLIAAARARPAAGGQRHERHERRRRMFVALRELLAKLAARRGLVLVIDDIQWGDGDSESLLSELLAPGQAPRALLLATVRSAAFDGAKPKALEEQGVDVRLMSLSTLEPGEARELVSRLSPTLDERQITTIVAEASGHPLFLQELVRHVEEHGGTTAAAHLDDALWARVEGLPQNSRALLELVCLAGVPIPHSLASQAAGPDYPAYELAVSTLRSSHLVRTEGVRSSDTIEPYHDRTRECVGARISARARVDVHRRLARVLEQAGAATRDPHSLVRHLEAAGELERAAQLAERAAQLAAEAFAFEAAAEFYRSALRMGGPDRERERERALELELAKVLGHAGRGSESASVFLQAAQGAEPSLRLDCQRAAARQFLSGGHIEPGLEALSAALDEVGVDMPASPRRALASLLWNRLRLRLRSEHWKAKAKAKDHDDDDHNESARTRLRVLRTAADGLIMVDSVRGLDFQARAMVLAFRIGDNDEIAISRCLYAAHLSVQGMRPHARSSVILAELERQFDGRPLPHWHYARSWNRYAAGEHRLCVADMRTALEAFTERPSENSAQLVNISHHVELYSLRALGEFNEARRLLGDYLRDATRRSDHFVGTSMRASASLQWLADDDPERVRVELQQARWLPPQGRFHVQHLYELESLSHLALYEGVREDDLRELSPRFAALPRSVLLRVQHLRIRMRSLWARLCAAAPSSPALPRHLAQARAIARKLEREGPHQSTLDAATIWAALAMREGDEAAAVVHLRRALALAQERELAVHAAAARWRLGPLLGGEEGQSLRADADAWMRRERVQDPERMVSVFVPLHPNLTP